MKNIILCCCIWGMAIICMPARAMSGNDTTQLFIERISDIDFHEQ